MWFKQLRCQLNIHHWHYETKGILWEGFVHAMPCRHCKHCGVQQVEFLDKANNAIEWRTKRWYEN